jgi:type II secretory pathway component PulF
MINKLETRMFIGNESVMADKINELIDELKGQEYQIKTIMAYEKPKEKKAFAYTPMYSDDKSNLTESLLTLHADMNQVAGVLVALINRHRRQARIEALQDVRNIACPPDKQPELVELVHHNIRRAIDKLIEECK